MPAPDKKHEFPEHQRQMVNAFMRDSPFPSEDNQLAYQVAELRRDIQDLKQALAPAPSIILTGRPVLDEFKRLTQGV